MEEIDRIIRQAKEQKKKLRSYYEKDFIPRLKQNSVGDPQVATYFPDRAPERYLKYHYAADNNQYRRDATVLEDAKDGSAWSAVHKEIGRAHV